MLRELDLVVLRKALPEHGLQEGDIGTVVLVHQGGAGYEVEFSTFTRDTIAVVTLPVEHVRPVGERDVARVREMA